MRTSPVHYIDPSAISIVPNCNNSANDIAVTISRNAKIKVYSPRAGIDKTTSGEYQEWTITGRNRRLANSTKPYTIYARLSALDNTAYLIFAPMTPQEDGEYMGEWTQTYSWVTTDGLYVFGKGSDWEEQRTKINCIFVRLGDVSLPDANNQRTVTLDTGILGTKQFNDEWALRPDELPLRIELGCTIGDEDAGPMPYVYWGQSLVLTAMLTEGWTGTDIQRFDRWEIMRNSGDAESDDAWNYHEVEEQDTLAPRLMPDGQITLNHARGADDDDFNGAVSVTFTILAVGHNADTRQREILKTVTINIMAETVEKYELSLSESIVSYDPQTQSYTPSTGVNVGIRATDQRGEVFDMTRGQIANASLVAEYAPVGSSSWTALTFGGSSQEAATANIATTAFALQQSVNVRLMRRITADGQTVAEKELSRTTIAFVRNGEDSKIREWIYRLNSNAGYDATTGTADGTAVSGQTDGVDNCLLVDDFVPSGWSDDPTGVSQPGDVEWESWRDYDDENHRWGTFHAPVIHNRYAEDGGTQDMRYQWNQSATTAPPFNSHDQNPGNGWKSTVPDRPGDGYYLWAISAVKKADGTYGTWGNAIRLTGDKGPAGEDGSDREYIYIRQNTYPFSGTLPANISTPDASSTGQTVADDDFVPNGWSDTALPADNDNRYVYMSVREKPAGENQTWGPFGNPVLWSNWGVRGTDGDGTEYVFIRTKNNVPPIMASEQTGYASDEFRPTITSASQTASLTEQAQTTDDPKGPNSTYPYEWVATRSKGDAASDGTRQWTKYTGNNNDYAMSLWSRWAEDGQSPVVLSLRCSAAVVSFKENSQGAVTCSPETYRLSLERTEGEKTTVLSAVPSGYSLKYNEDGTGWVDGQTLGNLNAVDEFLNGSVGEISYGLFKGDTLLQKMTVAAEWAEKGDKGDDGNPGYTVTLNPASVIITQKSDKTFDLSSNPVNIEPVVTKAGSTTNLVSSVSVAENYCLESGQTQIVTASVKNIILKITGVNATAIANLYTTGYVVLTITITSGERFSATLPVAVNYLGTYTEQTFDDHKETLAQQITTNITNSGTFVVNDSTYQGYVDSVNELNTWKQSVSSDVAKISNINARLSSAEGNISTVATTASDAASDASEAKSSATTAIQTANRISSQLDSGTNLLVNSFFEQVTNGYPNRWIRADSSIHVLSDEPLIAGGAQCYIPSRYLRQQIWGSSSYRKLADNSWFTLTFYAKCSDNFIVRLRGADTSHYETAIVVNGKETQFSGTSNLSVDIDTLNSNSFGFYTLQFKTKTVTATSTTVYIEFAVSASDLYIAVPRLYSGLSTGINIQQNIIDVTANNFTIRNNDGNVSLGVDAFGNLRISGAMMSNRLARITPSYNIGNYSATPYYVNAEKKQVSLNGNYIVVEGLDLNSDKTCYIGLPSAMLMQGMELTILLNCFDTNKSRIPFNLIVDRDLVDTDDGTTSFRPDNAIEVWYTDNLTLNGFCSVCNSAGHIDEKGTWKGEYMSVTAGVTMLKFVAAPHPFALAGGSDRAAKCICWTLVDYKIE